MAFSIRTLTALSLTGVLLLTAAPALAKKGGGGGGGGGSKGGGGAAPAPPPQANPAIAADTTALNSARTDYNTANAAYTTAVRKATTDFDATPEVVAAKKAVADAVTALNAAHDAVMAKLGDDADYKAAVAAETASQKTLDEMKDKDGTTQDDISAKAAEVFKLGGVTNKLEHTAMDADTGYQDAQTKLAAANAAMADLRKKFTESLKTDPTIGPLLQAKSDAQQKVTDAQTKLASDR